jgi:hypothetical protein
MQSATRRKPWIPAAVLAALASVAGCASAPAYRMALPAAVETQGKTIAVIGDLQLSPGIVRFMRRREHNALEQLVLFADLRERIDELGALVVVGDLVFSARSARDWRHFDALTAPFAERMPVLPAIGNHDYPCYFVELCRTDRIARGMRERFPWFEPGHAYAVDGGDVLLLFLDTESGLEAQGEWLEQQLAAAAGRYRAVLVFFHRPAFTHSIDRGAVGDPAVQAHVVPRLEAAPLPVVAFSGHVHGLEHIVENGVHYLTTAGGGGSRGPLGEERPGDRYGGPSCPQPAQGVVLRPFNYLLLRAMDSRLSVEIRGFCRGDAGVRVLDRAEIGF